MSTMGPPIVQKPKEPKPVEAKASSAVPVPAAPAGPPPPAPAKVAEPTKPSAPVGHPPPPAPAKVAAPAKPTVAAPIGSSSAPSVDPATVHSPPPARSGATTAAPTNVTKTSPVTPEAGTKGTTEAPKVSTPAGAGQTQKTSSIKDGLKKGAAAVLSGAGKVAEQLENPAEASVKVNQIAEAVAKHAPDSVARTIFKGQDAVQKGILAVANSPAAQKALNSLGVTATLVKSFNGAREGGLSKTAAGINAVGDAIGEQGAKLVGKEYGKVAGAVFKEGFSAGARGYAIGYDAINATIHGDKATLNRLSDSAAGGKLGIPAKIGDRVGDWAGKVAPAPRWLMDKFG
jgi:hypothetical protein